jgi:hypothetical protein
VQFCERAPREQLGETPAIEVVASVTLPLGVRGITPRETGVEAEGVGVPSRG